MLAEVKRRYGDEYIRRGQAGLLPEKRPDGKPADDTKAEGTLFRSASAVPPRDMQSARDLTKTPGQELPGVLARELSMTLGHDVSGVRVHHDAHAAASAAHYAADAYTLGSHIAFGANRYQPDTEQGRRLLAHELTHVVQARHGGGTATRISSPSDASEQEASRIAATNSSSNGGYARISAAPSAAVQRSPDPPKPFVDQWMKEHGVIGNRQFELIAALPGDQREAVLAEVRRRYGDEYIRRGQAGLLPEKEPDDKPADPLNAQDYWKKYGKAHMDAALERAMSKIDFEISGPGLTFASSECSAFTLFALVGRMQRLEPGDVSQLLDTDLPQLIDSVRVLDDLGRGADTYEPAVTERIVERLGFGLRRATSRLALPYALAREKAIMDARAKSPFGIPAPGLVAEPDADAIALTQPSPQSFGAETTIELGVAEAMTSGNFVEFNEADFGMVYLPQMSGEPRPVELDLERGSGDWKVARVIRPAGASAADVANALYGSPENAHLVAGRGDRYSFSFPPSGALAEPYDSMWREHIEQDEGGGPLDLVWGRAPSDPLLGLDDKDAELRALGTAAGLHADGDQAAVVQRLEIIQSHLTAIATAAGPLGVGGFVEPMLNRIKDRMATCAADKAEAQKWSAHSAVQISVFSEVKTAFDAITQQMFATGVPAVSTAEGDQLVGDVTASMKGPTIELTHAFASVVSAGDQLDFAKERLAIAKQRLAVYPFDMADRLLAMIRKRIASLDDYETRGPYARARLDALQAEISSQVAELRVAVVNGDGTAVDRLGELKSQLAMLDLQSTVGETISLIEELQNALFRSESWAPDTEREWRIYFKLRAALQPWRDLAGTYEGFWQAGHERDENTIAFIRRWVEELRKTTPLPALIKEAASFQEDEAKRQRIIAIGVMIAAVLVSAVTGGAASGAIGGFAGAVVGAGLESLTFTAITGTLDQDQTFGGFMAELGVNFVTGLGLRGISKGATWLAGGKLTLAGKAAEMSVEGLWMVAATKANEEIQDRLRHGEKMTTQTASTIFGHQMLISFATRVIGRGVSLFVEGRAEISKLKEVELYRAKQEAAEKLAQKFLDKGDDSLGAALVRADTETLRAEVAAREKIHEIATNPAEAEKHNLKLTPAELETFAAATRTMARELNEREINVLMQQAEIHADHVIAEPAVYAELLAKHREQGSMIAEGFDAGGNPKAKITPQAADGSPGTPFTIHSRLGDEVEEILAKKGLQPSADVHDYLAKRAGDRAGALADLRKVTSEAELDALMDKTLGSGAPRNDLAEVMEAHRARGTSPGSSGEELVATGQASIRPTPGKAERVDTEAGKFSHTYAEPLRAHLPAPVIPPEFASNPRVIPLSQLPDGLIGALQKSGRPGRELTLGVTSRVDRATGTLTVHDTNAGIIYEIKPDSVRSIRKGLSRAQEYANLANAKQLGGRTDWDFRVVVYNAREVRALIRETP
jgi:hypothetical protein